MSDTMVIRAAAALWSPAVQALAAVERAAWARRVASVPALEALAPEDKALLARAELQLLEASLRKGWVTLEDSGGEPYHVFIGANGKAVIKPKGGAGGGNPKPPGGGGEPKKPGMKGGKKTGPADGGAPGKTMTHLDRARDLISRGVNTHEDAIAVGRHIHNEIHERVKPQADQQAISVARMRKYQAEFAAATRSGAESSERESARQRWSGAQSEVARANEALRLARVSAVKDVLSEVRPMASEGDLRVSLVNDNRFNGLSEKVTKATSYFPKDWVDRSNAHAVKVVVGEAEDGRAYNRFDQISARSSVMLAARNDKSIAAHEMMHHMEHVVPGVKDLERQFYQARCGAETPRWLGSGYGRQETSRHDHWAHPYVGKDYNGHAYEILSMGVEDAISGRYGIAENDPEHHHFTLGVLAGVGHQARPATPGKTKGGRRKP